MMTPRPTDRQQNTCDRRHFLAAGTALVAGASALGLSHAGTSPGRRLRRTSSHLHPANASSSPANSA